jgi:hypothetical protein
MKTDFYPDPRRLVLGCAEMLAAVALIFYPVYTLDQPFTALQLASYLALFSIASVLIVLGFEHIADEFDRRKPEP